MRLNQSRRGRCRGRMAYTIAEVLVAVISIAIMLLSLYACFTLGFSVMSSSREDLRATQIMTRKTEGIRLCTWSQLLSNTPITFSENYNPLGTGTNSGGAIYTGTMTMTAATNVPSTATYYPNMKLVTVTLYWTNYSLKHPIVHTRQMQTQVARYGLQNYVFGAQ